MTWLQNESVIQMQHDSKFLTDCTPFADMEVTNNKASNAITNELQEYEPEK